MPPRPLIPRLAPNVPNIYEERAWREFQMAVRALEAMAELQEAGKRQSTETEVRE